MDPIQAPAAVDSPQQAFSGGAAGHRLAAYGFQINALQPWVGSDGQTRITVMENGEPVVKVITANGTLRKDEWKELDRTVQQIGRERLSLVADLRAAGLSRNLGGLGTLMAEYERIGDMGEAQIDMSGTTRAPEDTVGFDLDGVPVPIIHKGFRLNTRRLEASRKLGQGLDIVQGEVATRKVAEKIEDLFIVGSTITVDGRRIYGLTNFPQRNTVTLSDWNSPTTGDDLGDVLKMIDAATAARFYGPFAIYYAPNFHRRMLEDYKPESDMTRIQRLRNVEGISSVKVLDRLPANNVVMVQLTSDVIQVGDAVDITPVDWEEGGIFERHFKVFAALTPIIRASQTGQSGIVHGVAV